MNLFVENKREFLHKKKRNYKDLYEKPYKRDWMGKVVYPIQMHPTFGGRCNRYFWDIRVKLLRLPNFNMLFQLLLTKCFKSELFLCWPKVSHAIKSCKEPIMVLPFYCISTAFCRVIEHGLNIYIRLNSKTTCSHDCVHALLFHCICICICEYNRMSSLLTIRRLIASNQLWIKSLN